MSYTPRWLGAHVSPPECFSPPQLHPGSWRRFLKRQAHGSKREERGERASREHGRWNKRNLVPPRLTEGQFM